MSTKLNSFNKNMYQKVEKSLKVSDGIIKQIRNSILTGELKPGDKLASEKELVDQFKVSKSSMREALRALEVLGLIDIKKGIGGGTFVSKVDTNTTILSMINFLHFHPFTIKDITMVRYLIEPPVAHDAALRRTAKDIESLKTIIENYNPKMSEQRGVKGFEFHSYLARIAGNPILSLLIDFVGNVLESLKIKHGLHTEFFEQANKAHNIILECLIQQDAKATEIAIANDILCVGQYMSEKTNTPHFNPSSLENSRFDIAVGGNHNAKVVSEDDPLFKKSGGYSKRVGTSNLHIVFEAE
jgi:GntR family transcriptional repressor for pyruvate dehydrogenase complex